MKKSILILALVLCWLSLPVLANAANKVVASGSSLKVSADEPLAAFVAAFKFAEPGSSVICTKVDFSDGIAESTPNDQQDGVKFYDVDNEKKTILIVVIPFKTELSKEGVVVNLEFQGGIAKLDTTTICHQSGISLIGRNANSLELEFNPIVINPKAEQAVPKEFSLSQNYPNPFNPSTTISFALPNNCYVKLAVYNILGQKVKTLVDGEQVAGYKQVVWDGKNDRGEEVGSGIYFYRIQAGSFTKTAKMSLLK